MRLSSLFAILICLFFSGENGLFASSYTYPTASELSKQKRQEVDSIKNLLGLTFSDSLQAFYLEKIAKVYCHLNADSSIAYRRKAIEFCKLKGI